MKKKWRDPNYKVHFIEAHELIIPHTKCIKFGIGIVKYFNDPPYISITFFKWVICIGIMFEYIGGDEEHAW